MTRPTDPKPCTCPRARHRHGTPAAYTEHGCRCPPCRYAHSYARQVLGSKASALWFPRNGCTLRLRALARMGWSAEAVAARCDLRPETIKIIRAGKGSNRVTERTHREISRVYDALWADRRTDRYGRTTSADAAAKGWLPPLALDDDKLDQPGHGHINPVRDAAAALDPIAVQEAAAGRPVTMTPRERREAVRILTQHGLSAAQISERLRISPRRVVSNRTAA